MSSFFCELKPTLVAQQYSVKSPCFFYLRDTRDGGFDIYGLNDVGQQKTGRLEIFSNEMGEVSALSGSFTEDGKEISVSFKYDLFDTDVVLGSGEWIETVSGSTRQKYKAKIRAVHYVQHGDKFVEALISKYTSLDLERKELEKQLSNLTSSQKVSEERNEELAAAIKNYEVDLEKLSTSLAEAEVLNSTLTTLVNEAKGLGKNLRQIEESNIKLIQNLQITSAASEKTKEQAVAAKEKADDALSSAITVSIARSFKERKREAVRQRWIYDGLFVLSLIFGIIATYSVFDMIVPAGEGIVANLESLVSKLPFLIFFIWLGVFASKKSSSASRIEEFYAQKQALAESYEGYKGEILNNGKGSRELAQLMAINLLSINKDSGAIFDGVNSEKHSPLHELLSDTLNKAFSYRRDKQSTPDKNDTP